MSVASRLRMVSRSWPRRTGDHVVKAGRSPRMFEHGVREVDSPFDIGEAFADDGGESSVFLDAEDVQDTWTRGNPASIITRTGA